MKHLFWPFLLMIAMFACGSDSPIDDVVGAACSQDRDCAERCLSGGDYPGGFCSVSCRVDADCPSDTYCVDKSGGVCLFDCIDSADCDFLGDRYRCKDADDTAGRRIGVCLGD